VALVPVDSRVAAVTTNSVTVYPISRVGGNAADTLDGEDFAILSVAVSNGG